MAFSARRRDQPSGVIIGANPLGKTQLYIGTGVAPHVATQRWSYTVPSNKTAVLEAIVITFVRSAAAAPVGTVEAYVMYTPYGGSTGYIAFIDIRTNTVGDKDRVAVGLSVLLLSGDNLASSDLDNSTGGTVDYYESAIITEFTR